MTLLEVMMALSILVMIFGAALASLVNVAATVAAAKNRTRAVAVLNQRMEEMRSLTFANLSKNLAATGFTAGTETNADVTGTNARSFAWTRTVDTGAPDTSSDLLKVVVTVTWAQADRTRSISAYSYFAKNGVVVAESSS